MENFRSIQGSIIITRYTGIHYYNKVYRDPLLLQSIQGSIIITKYTIQESGIYYKVYRDQLLLQSIQGSITFTKYTGIFYYNKVYRDPLL
jgi:hypothetical protein